MNFEQKINYQLNKYPQLKKVIKKIYQMTAYTLSSKEKYKGNIITLSPNDGKEYFFGYYDKSPWDKSDRFVICLRAKSTYKEVSPKEKAEIILIDTFKSNDDTNRIRKIGETSSWNVQQGCMLQWLGPDYSSKIIYNDFRDGQYVSVILNIYNMKEIVVPAPVYSVSNDGKCALTLDFSRLYELRPGYGYYNLQEKTKGILLPDTTAIWRVDLVSHEVKDILRYKDFALFKPRKEMNEKDSVHKVNHLMINPDGNRFMVLYRWFNGHKKYTRLITCDINGNDMYLLSDDDMVSHCFWKDNKHILAFERKNGIGNGYFLMEDKTNEYVHCWPELTGDGHPSYSPNKKFVITDTYPDRKRMSSLYLMDGNELADKKVILASVYNPFKYDNDVRCDLHPRWNHNNDKICFDGVFNGHRGLYAVKVDQSLLL